MTNEQRWVVDLIEEGIASIELPSGKMVNVPLAILPKGVKAGQIIKATLEIDTAATKQALADSAAQVKKGREASKKRDPGGDVVL